MNAYLSIDVGTTNWKVAAFDGNASLIALVKTATVTHRDQSGSYFLADEIWENIAGLLRQIIPMLDGFIIRSVACTGMAESIVALDEKGRALNRIPAWFDPGTENRTDEIRRAFGSDVIFHKTGLDIHPMFVLSRWLRLREELSQNGRRCSLLLQMPEYITYQLCEAAFTDYSLASRTMLFNIRNNQWDEELLSFAQLEKSQLPQVTSAGSAARPISEQASAETGLPMNVMVGVGGHDHPCATLSAGVAGGNAVLDSSGTAESFLYVSKINATLPESWKGLRVCRDLSGDRYVLWGGIPAGGASMEWAFRQWKDAVDVNRHFQGKTFSYEDFCREYLSSVSPGCRGALFLPYLRGAGAPYWKAELPGGFLGLTTETTPEEMICAVLEGLGFQARQIRDLFQTVSCEKVEAFNTVGGGARVRFAQQIKADICGTDIRLYHNNEATLAGCAMLGAMAVGDVRSLEEAATLCSQIKETIIPHPDKTAAYEARYKIFLRAYPEIADLLKALAELGD